MTTGFTQGGVHGYGGDVFVTESRDEGRTFGPPRLLIDHRDEETNEHDSLITGLGRGRVLLITRSYAARIKRSFWSLSNDQGKTFSPRKAINIQGLDLDLQWGSAYVAFYGHALEDRESDSGVLLLSFYATLKSGRQQAGLARFNPEQGFFELRGWIWEGALKSCYLNETPLLRLDNGHILGLCREEPCLSGLHCTVSKDNGRTFSRPEPAGLFGEAANLTILPDKRILAIYRGLSQSPDRNDNISLSLSGDQGRTWSEPPHSGGVLGRPVSRGLRRFGGYGNRGNSGNLLCL